MCRIEIGCPSNDFGNVSEYLERFETVGSVKKVLKPPSRALGFWSEESSRRL